MRYGLAVVAIAAALGVALLAHHFAVLQVEFPVLLIAVALVVWYAGTAPGLVAFVNAIKELGVFWAVINQPPPGSIRRGPLA